MLEKKKIELPRRTEEKRNLYL